MTSPATGSDSGQVRQYGTVKWFGGHNKNTGRENQFGFIQAVDGRDVYLHKREWRETQLPEEGEFVTYFEEYKDGKCNARRAARLAIGNVSLVDLASMLRGLLPNPGRIPVLDQNGRLQQAARKLFCEHLKDATPEVLQLIVHGDAGGGLPALLRIVANESNESENYALLLDATGSHIMDEAPWACASPGVLHRFEADIASRVATLDPLTARGRLQVHLDILPAPLLTCLLAQQVYTSTGQLGRNTIRIYDYLKSVIALQAATFPDYLQTHFAARTNCDDDLPSNPVLRDIVENLLFKKSLFDRDLAFITLYAGSTRMPRNLETFVLYQLFSLVVAGNDRDTVYQVFLQRLWEALMTQSLPLEAQATRLEALFPSCHTLGALSCEAVHWEKQDVFLCRRKICHTPKVLPRPNRHYLDFSIYEWLAHYGIDYLAQGKPASKDFPIKLAGYFNRLREIFPLLHCHGCGELMLPDMRYARTEYKQVRDGVVETVSMTAAYRITVFHCNNQHCGQIGARHYINHCVGFGCHHIIDSRVLDQRCSEGRYICTGCGSCCPDHGQSHPAGFCGVCGSGLKIYQETVQGRTVSYTRKYAQCESASCGCRIGPEDLPARFSNLPAENES
ncbi:hypothetical protein [Massilia sp. CFBP9026]|uniref:cold-shock protein n=1 Tax=Massilia sp. CFBP9026 TaxID=3096536 RepID=UPI002A6B0D7E|nr:hypothetical protein [Massilia sp. CFBP9026]MDY0961598.1 hypothetical protein [Massilia sp. CFBP9026]